MKKVISVVLSFVFMCSLMAGLDFSAYAAGNSIDLATSINLEQSYSGSITSSNTADYYKFTISTSGYVSIPVAQYVYEYDFALYDANRDCVDYYYYCKKSNSNATYETKTYSFDLQSGTYYIKICQSYSKTGDYNFKVNYKSANESFREGIGLRDDSIDTANKIALNQTYNGQICVDNDDDYYKFTLKTAETVKISVKQYVYEYDFALYDANRDRVDYYYYCKKSNYNATYETKTYSFNLSAGTYYVGIKKSSSYSGNYSFSVNEVLNKPTSFKVATRGTESLKLSWKKISGATGYVVQKYSGGNWTTVKKITSNTNYTTISSLKSGSKYKFRVKAYKTSDNKTISSSYSSTLTTVTKPRRVSIKKVSSPSSSKVKTSWSKVGGSCTGYEIMYARNSKFTKSVAKKYVSGQSKTSYTGSGFAKNVKYYVKVRAYKTLDGKKYYGSWSNVKTVKCK